MPAGSAGRALVPVLLRNIHRTKSGPLNSSPDIYPPWFRRAQKIRSFLSALQISCVLPISYSNSLIIQKPKTKEIMHRDVFGYLMKTSSFFASLICPLTISLFEELYQTLTTTVAHTCHGKTYFSTAKLTFPRQNLLYHGKTYFSTAKLTLSRQNLLFHDKTYFSTAKLSFPRQNLLFHGKTS